MKCQGQSTDQHTSLTGVTAVIVDKPLSTWMSIPTALSKACVDVFLFFVLFCRLLKLSNIDCCRSSHGHLLDGMPRLEKEPLGAVGLAHSANRLVLVAVPYYAFLPSRRRRLAKHRLIQR